MTPVHVHVWSVRVQPPRAVYTAVGLTGHDGTYRCAMVRDTATQIHVSLHLQLRDPAVLAPLLQRLGPGRVLSVTTHAWDSVEEAKWTEAIRTLFPAY
jgi:hypothetical protein